MIWCDTVKNSTKKPWENIPITDILPYPSNYTKIVIISYVFAAVYVSFILICNNNISNNGLNSSISLIICQILVYAVFTFTLLYFYAQCNRKVMISEFLAFTKIVTVYFLGPLIIIILINRVLTNSGDMNLIHDLLGIITTFFYFLFLLIPFSCGPCFLIINHLPQARIHGILTTVPIAAVFFVYGISSLTLI